VTQNPQRLPTFTAGQALACGALWGVIVSVLQASNEAARALDLDDYLQLLGSLMMTFVPSGAAWHLALRWIDETCVAIPTLTAAIGASILLASLLNVGVTHLEGRLGLAQGMANMLGGQPELDSQILHVLWLNAFFGGLYSVGFVLHQRAMRQRLALQDVEILRSQSEGLLRQAELERLRLQVQPRLLLDVLSELRRRYAAPTAPAEPLLNRVVGFLRSARPSLREPRWTLRDELALARGYLDLCDEIGFLGQRWRLAARARAPDVAFPSLMLLTLIEQIGRASPEGSDITLRATSTADGGCLLRLSSSPPPSAGWLKPEIEFRLRNCLWAVCGERVALIMQTDRRWPKGTLGLHIEAPGSGSPTAPAGASRKRESLE
jgi:hypothetical protein